MVQPFSKEVWHSPPSHLQSMRVSSASLSWQHLVLSVRAGLPIFFFKKKFLLLLMDMLYSWTSLVAQRLKRLPPMRETRVWSLGREDPLEKEMAIDSSILAWRIPWTEKPSRLQSTGLQRVGHAKLYILIMWTVGQFPYHPSRKKGWSWVLLPEIWPCGTNSTLKLAKPPPFVRTDCSPRRNSLFSALKGYLLWASSPS